MNTSEILSSVQSQINLKVLPNGETDEMIEAITFYNDLISEMPGYEDIESFTICHNTGTDEIDSNLTIIKFIEDPDEKSPMYNYLTEKLNTGHDPSEFTWLGNILIISFEY